MCKRLSAIVSGFVFSVLIFNVMAQAGPNSPTVATCFEYRIVKCLISDNMYSYEAYKNDVVWPQAVAIIYMPDKHPNGVYTVKETNPKIRYLIIGTAGNDTITGGPGNDCICGGAGDDTIQGGRGNDRINGNEGNDVINGGKDQDILYGGKGNDILYGDLGDDKLFGDMGDDCLYGGPDKDSCSGGPGNDKFPDCDCETVVQD